MPQVSINWLYRHTYKDRRTIERHLKTLPRDSKGKFDSGESLEALYLGIRRSNNGNGEFVATPEAIRQLTIAKKQEIDLDMEIKRGDRIPREDCELALGEVVQAISGTLKAKRNQLLDDATINEIFGQLREVGKKMMQ